MKKASKSIAIRAKATTIFDYIAVPMNFLVLLPGLIKITNVTNSPAKNGDTYEWIFKILGVPLKGHMIITAYERPHLYIAQSSGMGTSIWIYEIKSVGRNKAEFTVTIEYDYPAAVVKMFASEVFDKTVNKELDQMIHNVKFVLEGSQ